MKVHFGLESHSDPRDQDDGTDEFIIAKYRADINNVDPPPEISLSKLERAIVQHFIEIKKQHKLLEIIEDDFIHHSGDRSGAPEEKIVEDGDNGRGQDDTGGMNDITREEFNAKIETIEAKMDARVESVSAKIEGFLAAQAERDKRLDGVLAQIGKDNGETKTSISSMKTTLIVTAVSTVLAIVLGVAGFNTALTSNMLSAFQLGKSSPTQTSETVAPEASKSSPASTSPPAVKSGS